LAYAEVITEMNNPPHREHTYERRSTMNEITLSPGWLLIIIGLMILLNFLTTNHRPTTHRIIYVPIDSTPEHSGGGCLPIFLFSGFVLFALYLLSSSS